MRLAIRTPDHLGDGVMALPAIMALAARYPSTLYAPRWGAELYVGLTVCAKNDPPVGDIGVLFKPSFGAAWRWRHLARRVGLEAGRRFLLSDPVVDPGGHRREGYAAVAKHLGVFVEGLPVYQPRGTATPLPLGSIALNPWSPSPTVRWPYFRALALALREKGHSVVFFCGPGEQAHLEAITEGFLLVAGLSLPDFAATLMQCQHFISNDSGAAHFAAACGLPVTMLHGSTAALSTGVGRAIHGPDLWCRPCYRKFCVRGGMPCLTALSVEKVIGTVQIH